MKISKIGVFALLVLSCAAVAGPPTHEEKITELVSLTGLAETLDQSRTSSRVEAHKLSDQLLDQIFDDPGALDVEQRKKIAAAARRFSDACADSLDVDEAVAKWGEYYAASLSEEELDDVLRYYRSPVGRKDVAATKAAMPLWLAYLSSHREASMQLAVKRYSAELEQIMSPDKP